MIFYSILETLKYLSNQNEANKEMKRLIEEDNILDEIYSLKR